MESDLLSRNEAIVSERKKIQKSSFILRRSKTIVTSYSILVRVGCVRGVCSGEGVHLCVC